MSLLSAGDPPDYTALTFPDPPRDRPTVIVNIVISADGQARIGKTEQGLGSATDQRLMRELRAHADIVLNGAETLRASGTNSRLEDRRLEEMRVARGLSSVPRAAVISRSGDLPLDADFFTADDFDGIVYLSDRASADQKQKIEASARPVVSVPDGAEVLAMLRHMRTELGVRLVLAEGGPALNGALFDVDAVDEFFVSIGGLIVGGEDSFGAVRTSGSFTPRRLQLVGVSTDIEHGETYLRYRHGD